MTLRRLARLLLGALVAAGTPYPAWSQPDSLIPPDSLPVKLVVTPALWGNVDAPVYLDFPSLARYKGPLALEEIKDGKPVPVACQMLENGRLYWILAGTTRPGSRRTYRLRAATPEASGLVVVASDGALLDVRIGDRLALRYHCAEVAAPSGASPLFARSAFIHPLCSPSGEILTQSRPPDHLHHMGLWNAWTHTRFEGREMDFWNLGAGQGTVRFKQVLKTWSGPVCGGFSVVQEHVDLKAPGGPVVALHEQLDVSVYPLPVSKGRTAYLLDYISHQKCATEYQLLLEKYRYGGLGYRARADWNKTNSHMLTSEGKTRDDANTTRCNWCDVAGKTAAGQSGILFMCDAKNARSPEAIRIWPTDMRPDQLFFNFCPVQEATQEDFPLRPGPTYTFHYRMLVYDGQLSAEEADAIWMSFNDFPRVQEVR